jgi:signal transduction histidine kinase/pSer/pThr/pTyr-binding forkhead associated (FHA) protein
MGGTMTKIYIIDGPTGGQSFDLEDGTTLIGRASNNDIQITDYSISRNHLKIIRKGESIFIEDLGSRNGTWVNGNPVKPREELEVQEGVPIIIGDTLLGLGEKYPIDGTMTRYSINLLDEKGQGEKIQLYKDRRATNRRNLELIYEVSTILMQSLDINEISEKIMDSLFFCLKRIDAGAILLINPDTGELEEIISRSRDRKENIEINYSRTIVDQVIREGKALMISDTSREDTENLAMSIAQMQIKSIMCVPLVSKSEIRGAFYVHSVNVPQGFRKDDLFLLAGLGTPAALAIENGMLHAKQKRVEESLQKAHRELEHRVEERTAELVTANEQLKQEIEERKRAQRERQEVEERLHRAKKMEAIGALAGGVAHDLNNILSGIVSYPELLLMDIPEDSPMRGPLLTIQGSGKKAATIVQDLLTLARRGVATTEVVDLEEIVAEYLKTPEFEKLIAYHPDVLVETYFDPDLSQSRILGSPVHLSKTVMNLVSNAAEAMPEGGTINISVETRYVDSPIGGYDSVEEGDFIVLTVSDAGEGMAAEDLERIFEPFYTKKKMGRSGTGLGMAVVWGTVKDHNGYIDIKSAEGKGTRIELYFPATRQEPTEGKQGISIDKFMGTERILVVDDVKEQREIAYRMLTKLGYSVTTLSSGEEAIDYMKDHSADLLVLDMIMEPGIDGLETYKKILELHPGQKAIIASGFSETDRAKEAQRLGAGAYIQKPYPLEKMAVAVRAQLDN